MIDFKESVLKSAKGKTHIFSVGQAGFIIKSANGQLLGIDLYLSNCVERVEGHVGYKRLLPPILSEDEIVFDYLIATHFHRDHFDIDAIPGMMKNNRTKLFAAYDCVQDVERLEIEKERVSFVKPGDSFNSGDFEVTFINCDHGTGAPKAVGVIVVVDGKIIIETGDTCLRLDRVDEYLSKGKIDVLIAPINGAYGNLNERECASLSEATGAKITIPCHYGMFASHHGDVGKFYEIMSEQKRSFHIMTLGEDYQV